MSEQLKQARNWWSGLAERERQVLGVGALALALITGYLAVWEPLQQLHHRRENALADARRLAERLELLAAAGHATPSPARAGNRSLLSIVDQSGKSSRIGKAPSRVQPDGDSTVRIWYEDVPFDEVARWLADLHGRHGVNVTEAVIERQSGSGLVNARLTLAR